MGPFIFLDTETTGVDPSRDHIIEVAAIRWENGKITERYESLVNPRIPLPYEITLLTGITNEHTAGAPLFADVKKPLCEFIGDIPIVGHNIAFDTAFLRSHHIDVKNPEIDTIALARILLQKESSYALEVLMKKYGLTRRESHRAMVDCETTIEFFEFLLRLIAEIPRGVAEEIKMVLEKSDWAGKEAFLKSDEQLHIFLTKARAVARPNMYGLRDGLGIAPKVFGAPSFAGHDPSTQQAKMVKKIHPLSAAPQQIWHQEITNNFLSGQKILLESPAEIPFENLKNQPLLIVYATPRKRDELMQTASRSKLTATLLKEPSFYLSPKKLAEKLEQDHFVAEETPFLLKMMLWNQRTETGDREELTLEREEFGLFDVLADHEGQDTFWKKALKTADASKVVLVHQYALARGITQKFPIQTAKKRALIIAEAARLEDSFTNALQMRFTESDLRPIFGEKITLFFGLMGIFYERFVSEDDAGFKGNVILDGEIRSVREWQRVLDALANLPDHPKKHDLAEAFAPEPNRVAWLRLAMNELVFSNAPVMLAEHFYQCTASFQKILLQSEALSGDGTFRMLRELFELDATWKEIKDGGELGVWSSQGLTIKIPEGFPEPYSEGYFKRCIKLFTEIIREKHGRALFLLSSKKTVEAMYQTLLPIIQPTGTKLLGIGPSGGKGKSLALFLENPDRSVLLTTNQILPHLPEIESSIEVIVFQKIPFDPPNDPILSARGKQFENGFEQYTLPRAITRFREILAELGKSGTQSTPKTCYLLDSRLKNRDYGRLFI